MMVNAADKDVSNLYGPQGRQCNMVGTPEGLSHELAALQPIHLGNPRGRAARYFRKCPQRRRGGVEQLAACHRDVTQLTLLVKREETLVTAAGSLPQDRRHIEAGVCRPQLGGRTWVALSRVVGPVTHLGRKLPVSQVV